MKNYETSIYWEKGWAFGFWCMRGWFGVQCFSLKIVVSKKCEPIEPMRTPKFEADLFKCADKLSDQIAEAFCWGTQDKKITEGAKTAPAAPEQR